MVEIEFETVYKNRKTNVFGDKTFFLRKKDGMKNYPEHIKKFDKLIFAGVFDHATSQYQEWPYSFKDQEAMWLEVIKTFVLHSKHQTVMKRWKDFIEEAMSSGMLEKYEG